MAGPFPLRLIASTAIRREQSNCCRHRSTRRRSARWIEAYPRPTATARLCRWTRRSRSAKSQRRRMRPGRRTALSRSQARARGHRQPAPPWGAGAHPAQDHGRNRRSVLQDSAGLRRATLPPQASLASWLSAVSLKCSVNAGRRRLPRSCPRVGPRSPPPPRVCRQFQTLLRCRPRRPWK